MNLKRLPITKAEPFWAEKWVWAAFAAGLAIRAVVALTATVKPMIGPEEGYVETAAALASGRGLIMSTDQAVPDPAGIGPSQAMKNRQSEGGFLDAGHPYPKSVQGWIPATLHPPGYSLLLYLYYRLGNFSGMVAAMRWTQIIADSAVCILLFLFGRNVFDRKAGILASWVFAVLPPAILYNGTLLPDAWTCFLTAVILAIFSYALSRGPLAFVLAGLATGLACYFRPEFLLYPAVMFVALGLTKGQWLSQLGKTALACGVMLLVLSPWAIWNRHSIGRVVFTSTSAGGTMYEALGERPDNPWGIVLRDEWVNKDAASRGYGSAWSSQADEAYRRLFKKCVAEHPGEYVKLVLVNRLPMALAPAHTFGHSGSEFNFTNLRVTEGLTRWGVMKKYPLKVIRYMWFELMMAGLSFLLLLALVIACWLQRRQWRRMAWLVLPWGYVVASMSLIKQIEPRNMTGVLIVQAVALSFVVLALWEGHLNKAGRRAGPNL